MGHFTIMKNHQAEMTIFLVVISALALVVSSSAGAGAGCGDAGMPLVKRIERLDWKVKQLQNYMTNQTSANEQLEWRGDQSQFGSFRRMSAEAKSKLKSFYLENTEEMKVSTLLEELRPCINLESIVLDQVELLGTFPNSTEQKLLLPNLTEFSLQLTNSLVFTNDVLFFRKTTDNPLTILNVVEVGTNIDIWIGQYRQLCISHEFGELVVLDRSVQDVLARTLTTPSFKLARLTVWMRSISTEQIPRELQYLNMKFTNLNEEYNPTTEYVDILQGRTQLVHVHINADPYLSTMPIMNLDQLPSVLKAVSFSRFRVNTTTTTRGRGATYFGNVERLLLDNCIIDNRVMKTLHRRLPKIEKLALIPGLERDSALQCHPLIYDLTYQGTGSTDNNPKLESIFVADCPRNIVQEYRPRAYRAVENFLTGLGIDSSTTSFELRRRGSYPNYMWTARKASYNERSRVRYEFADWYKIKKYSKYDRL